MLGTSAQFSFHLLYLYLYLYLYLMLHSDRFCDSSPLHTAQYQDQISLLCALSFFLVRNFVSTCHRVKVLTVVLMDPNRINNIRTCK